MFCRVFTYHLCQTTDFPELRAVFASAKQRVAQYGAIRAAGKLTAGTRQQIATLFGRSTWDEKLAKAPPLKYVIMSQFEQFDKDAYDYFRKGPEVTPWFYHGKVPTQRITYHERMYDSAAHDQFMLKRWVGTNYAALCGWVYMKKSQFKLQDYGLRGVMKHFFSDDAESQKLDLTIKDMHAHMQTRDPAGLWEVAKYCCRDAVAVIFLLEKLSVEVNMRQNGWLMRTSVEIQADCGMQRMVRGMLDGELERGFVINNATADTFDYEGATVIEPCAGFYEDPVRNDSFRNVFRRLP